MSLAPTLYPHFNQQHLSFFISNFQAFLGYTGVWQWMDYSDGSTLCFGDWADWAPSFPGEGKNRCSFLSLQVIGMLLMVLLLIVGRVVNSFFQECEGIREHRGTN